MSRLLMPPLGCSTILRTKVRYATLGGTFAALHKLTPEQIIEAELTRKIALEHDTMMVEPAKDGRGKGTILG